MDLSHPHIDRRTAKAIVERFHDAVGSWMIMF